MESNLTATARAALLNLGVPGVVAAAGGVLRVALFYLNAEVSGNGYSRKSTTLSGLSENDDGGTFIDLEPVTFTASGGSIVYDQVRVFNRRGETLFAKTASITPVTIASGGSHTMTLRFEIPATDDETVESGYSGLVDLRDFDSRAGDMDFDNRSAIMLALAQAATDRMGVRIPGGDWCIGDEAFDTSPLPSSMEQFFLCGIAPEFTRQHQEETGPNLDRTYFSRLRSFAPAGTVLFDLDRSARFGQINLQNLTFRAENQVTFFRITDSADNTAQVGSIRGLWVDGCYFSCIDGNWNGWLINNGTAGWTRSGKAGVALDLKGVYDGYIGRSGFRGWGQAAIVARQTDGLWVDNCSSMLCPLYDGETVGNGQMYVPTKITGCWTEAHGEFGVRGPAMQVTDFRSENGYNTGFTPDIQPYSLASTGATPSSVAWTVAIGASVVAFTGFESGYDCTDYFRVGDFVELTPSESTESTMPPRLLQITAVATNQLTFARSTTSSYITRAISGGASAIRRIYGAGIAFTSDRGYLNGFTIGQNEATEIPKYIVVPNQSPLSISSNGEQYTLSEGDRPRIAAASAGGPYEWGGVAIDYRRMAPDHPLVETGVPVDYHAGYKRPLYFPATRTQLYVPGIGCTSISNNARDLAFHRIEDTQLREYVWCYRLSDTAQGWILPALRRQGVALDYEIRAYRPAGAGSANLLFGCSGVDAQDSIPLSEGWQTVTGSLTTGQLATDAYGPYLRAYSLSNTYIAYIKIVQPDP